MIFLKVNEIKFVEVKTDDPDLYIGHFTRAQLEDMLKKSQDEVFSVYFNQDEIGSLVRLTMAPRPFTSRDGDEEFLPCPIYCNP